MKYSDKIHFLQMVIEDFETSGTTSAKEYLLGEGYEEEVIVEILFSSQVENDVISQKEQVELLQNVISIIEEAEMFSATEYLKSFGDGDYSTEMIEEILNNSSGESEIDKKLIDVAKESIESLDNATKIPSQNIKR